MPRSCEDLVRNIYNFFAHSAKRKDEFKQFQLFCNIKPHKILHPSVTRWLLLHEAVNRILEQWQPLKLYFQSIMFEERLIAIEKIHESLLEPSIFLYLNFLDLILPKFNRFDCIFQANKPTVHLLDEEVGKLYIELLTCFCIPDKIKKKIG